MLERYFARPATIDRMRASWIAAIASRPCVRSEVSTESGQGHGTNGPIRASVASTIWSSQMALSVQLP